MDTFNGVVYHRECATFCVDTDASNIAGGIFCGGDWYHVNWEQDIPGAELLHINYKKVLAVLVSAEKWGDVWFNGNVTVITDSTVAKAIINKGTCKNPFIMDILRSLFWLQVKYNFKLCAIHVAGKLNQLPE